MGARITTTDGRTFKGRTIASVVRTNFGSNAVFVPGHENGVGTIENGAKVIAEVQSATEFKRERPKSRQTRWDEAVGQMQSAIEDAESIWEDKEEADRIREEAEDAEDEPEEEPEDDESLQQRLDAAVQQFNDGVAEIESLKEEYADWEANLPEQLQGGNSPVSEKLQEIEYIDVNEIEWAIEDNDPSEAQNMVDELEGADLPRGWGRD